MSAADFVQHSCGEMVYVDDWEEHDGECPKGFGGAFPVEAARLPSTLQEPQGLETK